jgi:hypothetical protein
MSFQQAAQHHELQQLAHCFNPACMHGSFVVNSAAQTVRRSRSGAEFPANDSTADLSYWGISILSNN